MMNCCCNCGDRVWNVSHHHDRVIWIASMDHSIHRHDPPAQLSAQLPHVLGECVVSANKRFKNVKISNSLACAADVASTDVFLYNGLPCHRLPHLRNVAYDAVAIPCIA